MWEEIGWRSKPCSVFSVAEAEMVGIGPRDGASNIWCLGASRAIRPLKLLVTLLWTQSVHAVWDSERGWLPPLELAGLLLPKGFSPALPETSEPGQLLLHSSSAGKGRCLD